MNLCIDQGNTNTKIALFEDDILFKSFTIEAAANNNAWDSLFTDYRISNTIISSVKDIEPELVNLLKNESSHFLLLSYDTPIPILNLYNTPETLGKDRLAAVIGANALHPENDILVIDAGTALTFDFISKQGEYAGGTIAPGMNMRFQALHTFTKKLPLVQTEGEIPFLGLNSERAIRSGVINGMTFEIEGYINRLKIIYPKLLVFLTGGDCFFFESRLKSSIFVNQNLVLIGLNSIIKYNAKNNEI